MATATFATPVQCDGMHALTGGRARADTGRFKPDLPPRIRPGTASTEGRTHSAVAGDGSDTAVVRGVAVMHRTVAVCGGVTRKRAVVGMCVGAGHAVDAAVRQ